MKTAKKKVVRKDRPINDRMRRFCELVVSGHKAGRAYEMAGYANRGALADVEACKLLRKPKVAEYLNLLREQASAKAEFTRDDLVGFLVQEIKTPADQVLPGNPLLQRMKVDEAGGYLIESYPKSQATKQLAEIMGWNKPQEVKVDVSEKLAEIVRRVRGS
jgi:hypothetical protein